MNARFYSNFFSIMVETAIRKVALSMYHKCDSLPALIEADLGAEYSKANSPNPSPGRMVLLA